MTVDRDETCSEWAMILVIASCTVTSRVNGSFDHTVVCMGDVHGWDWSLGFERGSTSSSNVQEAGSSLTRSLYNAPQSPTFFFIISIISIISSIDQDFSLILPNINLQYFHSSNPEPPLQPQSKMQFSAIFALSLAVMASASPVVLLEERTTGKTAQSTCDAKNNGSTAVCCNSKESLVGVVLSLIAVKSTCGLGKTKHRFLRLVQVDLFVE